MNYLDKNVPPTREERLQACNSFGGTACGLVKGSKQGCLGSNNRGFLQSTGCQLGLTMGIAGTIPESVVVFHGPVGCGSSQLSAAGLSAMNQKSRGNSIKIQREWFSTNLSESDVVGGGEDKLAATVIEVDRRHRPKVIWVAATCVPGIIGDDIDAVVKRIQPQVAAKILPLHCAGFKTRIVATAYDVVYHAILRYLIDDPDLNHEPVFADEAERLVYDERKSRTINLLNVGSMSRIDEDELVRLLKALNLEVNILPCFAPPDRFVRAKDAALSVSICATHDDYFVEHLKEIWGVPFILNTIPIGKDHTRKWLYEIADFFGIREQAERLVAAEEAELDAALAPIKETLKGKRVYVSAGEIRAGAQAIVLQNDLDMEVVGVRAHHYDTYGDVLFQDLDPDLEVNVATSQPFEAANLVKRANPDIYVGHAGGNVTIAKLGIPVLPIFGPLNNYLGYKGTFEFAFRLARILKNPAFFRNLGRTDTLPYKKSWYSENPFKYIRQAPIDEGEPIKEPAAA